MSTHLSTDTHVTTGGVNLAAGKTIYRAVADRAISVLWSMRSQHDLLGTSLNMSDRTWVSTSGGIGASADSFYEYMLKAYMLFGTCKELYHDGNPASAI